MHQFGGWIPKTKMRKWLTMVCLSTPCPYRQLKMFFAFVEYLLGDTILAAPILEENSTERDIFLPAGAWKDAKTGEVYEGSMWIRKYKAELDELPYFIRQT